MKLFHMFGRRDEFSSSLKRNLSKRAGQRCSNPNCGIVTSGPHEDENRAINVGVAAHITAAASGGPRYNEFLAPDGRASITNAIWLCQKCAKLIDSDVDAYTEELLRLWKRRHEAAIKAEIEGIAKFGTNTRLPARLTVDAIFSHPSVTNKACVLDIRVSNPGGSDLMINAVRFRVVETVEQMLMGHSEYSAAYDLDIGQMRDHASTEECQVAQILKPGEADRFAIILSDSGLGNPSVGGWRLATLFRTNVGDVAGPDIEVWLPYSEKIPPFDELTGWWLAGAQFVRLLARKEFQTLSSRPYPVDLHRGFLNSGGGALAYPTIPSGYETMVAFDLTLAFYRGPQLLWERERSMIAATKMGAELQVAQFFYEMHGADAPNQAKQICEELATQGQVKLLEGWQRVLEQVKLLAGEK
jgi:hypothetical protein